MKEIKLTNSDKVVLVDESSFEELSKYNWQYQTTGAVTFKRIGYKRSILMHRLLMGCVNTKVYVDHINGNNLDNRKENLRLCTNQQNNANKSKWKLGKSKYKGVSSHHQTRKWRAYITVFYKQLHLGFYETEIEAAKVYNEAAIKHFGEFAKLNEV